MKGGVSNLLNFNYECLDLIPW